MSKYQNDILNFKDSTIKIDNKLKNKPINVEPKAAIFLSNKLSTQHMLRIAIQSGGCKGFIYDFIIEDKNLFNDKVDIIILQNPMIVIDKDSYFYIPGSTIKFENTIYSHRLYIENLAAEYTCSCGNSFGINYEN